jgi:hypothetical protein
MLASGHDGVASGSWPGYMVAWPSLNHVVESQDLVVVCRGIRKQVDQPAHVVCFSWKPMTRRL